MRDGNAMIVLTKGRGLMNDTCTLIRLDILIS